LGYPSRLSALLLATASLVWGGTACSSNVTLADYDAMSPAGCTYGNFTFSNFSYQYLLGLALPETADPNVTATQINVTIDGPNSSPTVAFQPTQDWVASAGFQTQIDIGYTVTVSLGPNMGSSWATLTGTAEDRGGSPSNITSQLGYSPGGTLHPSIFPDSGGFGSGGLALNNVAAVTVGDLITLDSGGSGGTSPNTTTLTEFQQNFTQMPEPASALVVALGLLTCGWLAFRRSRRAASGTSPKISS